MISRVFIWYCNRWCWVRNVFSIPSKTIVHLHVRVCVVIDIKYSRKIDNPICWLKMSFNGETLNGWQKTSVHSNTYWEISVNWGIVRWPIVEIQCHQIDWIVRLWWQRENTNVSNPSESGEAPKHVCHRWMQTEIQNNITKLFTTALFDSHRSLSDNKSQSYKKTHLFIWLFFQVFFYLSFESCLSCFSSLPSLCFSILIINCNSDRRIKEFDDTKI